MRPAFSSGVLVLPTHTPFKEPTATTEFGLPRRPVRLNEAPQPRSKNYELIRQLERQEMLKGLISEKGLKIDSGLNEKLFDVTVTDPVTGAVTTQKTTLSNAINLPINQRIEALQVAVAAKDISAADRAALQAIVANTSRTMVLEDLNRDQLAGIQRLIHKLGKPLNRQDATLGRFHDFVTMNEARGLVELFLLSSAPQDATGKPTDYVTDPAGNIIPTNGPSGVLAYLQANPTQLIDLDSKTIIAAADAPTLDAAEHNKWDTSVQAIKTKPIAPGGAPAPAPGGGPPPPPPPPIKSPGPGGAPVLIPPPSVGAPGSIQIMKVHVRDINETWPDPASVGRKILETWHANQTQDAKKDYYAIAGASGKKYVQIGEENRYNAMIATGRLGDTDWKSATV